MEACEDVRKVGNRVAEVGFEYFCLEYVSKNGVSVMECNTGFLKYKSPEVMYILFSLNINYV